MNYIFTKKPLDDLNSTHEYKFYNLPKGFGNTFGNSIRRTILNSTPGLAIVAFKLNDLAYEFTYLDGVKQDLMEIAFNLRKVKFIYDPNFTEKTFTVIFNGPREVSSEHLATDESELRVLGSQTIFDIVDDISVKLTFIVRNDVGFVMHNDNQNFYREMIGITSLHSGVEKVNFTVEKSASDFNDVMMIIIDSLNIYEEHFILLNALYYIECVNKYLNNVVNALPQERNEKLSSVFMPRKIIYEMSKLNVTTHEQLHNIIETDQFRNINKSVLNYVLLYLKYSQKESHK